MMHGREKSGPIVVCAGQRVSQGVEVPSALG